MSALGKAVFLSYAREDAAAARRIAEALRAHGVEVWFDENELRGGDAWDAKIRKQIKECALFMPVVSAHTQERGEGYFRLEWKLAVERTQLMAEGVPFFAPVVIDETPDSHAAVPAEFLRVQWMRLPGALPSADFVAQVKRLLEAPRKPSEVIRSEAVHAIGGQASRSVAQAGVGGEAAPVRAKPRILAWIVAAMAVVAVVLVGIWMKRIASATPDPGQVARATPGPAAQPPSDFATASSDKSIAVLPFVNLSDDKENTAFFADGMHEDILTNLANIPELRVISRTSVMEYRDTQKKIPQIARELGVAYILEGSVRRAGNQVRITGQLIRAAKDEHLWAKSYDRELTPREMFSIQAALSTEIAGALRAVLSPEAKKLLERRPTENLSAYDLYLKARQLRNFRENGHQQEAFLRTAVALDPAFAAAWAALGAVHAEIYGFGRDRTAGRLAQAKAAIDTAVRLAPDLPEVVFARGNYYYDGIGDFGGAMEQFERVARMQPNNSNVIFMLGGIYRRTGRWSEAMAALRKSVELEPGNFSAGVRLAHLLEGGRRYAEARAEWQRMAAQFPNRLRLQGPFNAALDSFRSSGSPNEVDAFFAGSTDSAEAIAFKRQWAQMTGNFVELARLDKSSKAKKASKAGSTVEIDAAIARAAQGDLAGARALLNPAPLRSRLEREPTNENLWRHLSKIEALLGHADEALRCARKAAEVGFDSADTRAGPGRDANLAFVYAWTGDRDSAIAEYAKLLRTPYSGLNVHEMKRDPTYTPLRGDPRFEALLNDPKNNQPLF